MVDPAIPEMLKPGLLSIRLQFAPVLVLTKNTTAWYYRIVTTRIIWVRDNVGGIPAGSPEEPLIKVQVVPPSGAA